MTYTLGPPTREAFWATTHSKFSNWGSNPYAPGQTEPDGRWGYWLDGWEHYDPILCFMNARDYAIRKGLPIKDYSAQINAGLIRFRDRAVRAVNATPENGETPGVPEYHRYLTGIARHYYETGDVADIEAARYLSPTDKSPTTFHLLYAHSGVYRETAFILLTCLDWEWMGLGPHPMTDEACRTCLYHNEVICLPKDRRRYGAYLKPFMAAINMMALIRYWSRFRRSLDPVKAALADRVPASVEALCGYIWEECWYPPGVTVEFGDRTWDKGSIAYRDLTSEHARYAKIGGQTIRAVIDPRRSFKGPLTLSDVDDYYTNCVLSIPGVDNFQVGSYKGADRTFTIQETYLPGFDLKTSTKFDLMPGGWQAPDEEGRGPSPDLNHMLFPAFAWLYWYRRRLRGDEDGARVWGERAVTLFDSCLHSWQPPFDVKQSNQSLLWTTDGLDWLERGDAEWPVAKTYALEAPVTGLSAKGGQASGPFRVSIPHGYSLSQPVPMSVVMTQPGAPGVAFDSVAGGSAPDLILTDEIRKALFEVVPDMGGRDAEVKVAATSGGMSDPPPLVLAVDGSDSVVGSGSDDPVSLTLPGKMTMEFSGDGIKVSFVVTIPRKSGA